MKRKSVSYRTVIAIFLKSALRQRVGHFGVRSTAPLLLPALSLGWAFSQIAPFVISLISLISWTIIGVILALGFFGRCLPFHAPHHQLAAHTMFHPRQFVAFGVACLLLLMLNSLMGWVTAPARAAAGINQQINFQGRLLNAAGAVVPDGNYNIEFKIYSGGPGNVAGDTGGTLQWTEDWLNAASNGVVVRNGYFSINLGSITSLSTVDFNSDTLWLSMNIGDTFSNATFAASSPDGEMLPMKRLTANPYAFNSAKLGGLAASAFGQLSANNTFTGTNLFQTSSTTALQVAAGANALFSVDTSGNNVVIGKAGALTGTLQFANATGANTVGLQAAPSSAAYTLSLPTSAPSTSQCLQSGSTTASLLQWGSCGTGGGSTLQAAYTASTGGTTPEIIADSTRNGIDIQDANTTLGAGTTLLAVRASATSTTLGALKFGVTNNGNVTYLGTLTGGSAGQFTVDTSGNINAGIITTNGGGVWTTLSTTGIDFGNTGSAFTLNGAAPVIIQGVGGSGGTALVVTGTVPVSATASLIGIGNSIVGGNSSTNGGTWLGLNAPSTGAGSAADFLNFQQNGVSHFKIDHFGVITGPADNSFNLQAVSGFNMNLTSLTGITLATSDLELASTSTDTVNINGTAQFNQNVTVSAGKNLKLTGSGTRPSSPTAGTLYYDTTANQLIQYNGTKWVSDKSPAIIVAASNSTQAAKDAADFVATGTGDQATINAALTAVSGGTVYLMAGTYNLTAGVTIPNNTILAGAGGGTIITIPNAQNGSYDMIKNTDTATGTNVTIRDLVVDGNNTNQTAGTMYGIHFNHMGGGSGASARPGGSITNVTVKKIHGNTGTAGIYLFTSNGNIIRGSTLLANGADGIDLDTSSNNAIQANISQANGYGIGIFAGNNNSISGNLVQANSEGMFIQDSNNTITGNTVQANSFQGIENDTNNNTISGNTVNANGWQGLYIGGSNNTITGNNLSGNGNTGNIFLLGGNNEVSGNKVTTVTVDGITAWINSSSNTITGNDITCSASCFAIDIDDTTSNKNYLADNRFSATSGSATINDAGTGTIYANQSRTADGGQSTFRNANDAAAFQVQNVSGNSVLTADTSGGNVIIGKANTLTGTLQFASTGGSNLVGIQAASGTAAYTLVLPNAAPGTTQCLQGGATTATNLQWGSCGSGGSVTLAAVDSAGVANANGATLTGSTLNLNSASASFAGVVNTGTQTFAGSKTFQSSSATAFVVQNTSSAKLFQVDTANNNIYIGGNNSGEIQPWQSSSGIPIHLYHHTAATANGYVYVMGGCTTASFCTNYSAAVYYAKLNANGSVGVWNGATSLPAARWDATSVVANGYLYEIGGGNSSGIAQSSVYYAKLNADGTLGTWNTGTSIPSARYGASSTTANGYVYVMGGADNGGNYYATVYYAKLNSDGSVGAWSTNTSNPLTQNRADSQAVAANGYVYVIDGANSLSSLNSVIYAPLNSTDGSVGAWTTSPNTMSNNLFNFVALVDNGYLYAFDTSRPYYAKLNNNGSIGTWATSTQSNASDQPAYAAGVVANGYMYILGGDDGFNGVLNTVYYTSTQRVQIGGSLDLVGLSGTTLADAGSGTSGSSGGSIVAGNGTFVGSLQVQGAATLQSLAVNNTLNVGGSLTVQTQSNSTTAFQVELSSGTPVLTVDTSNSQAIVQGVNSSASTGSELVTSQAFNNATYWTCASGWTTTATTATHTTGNTTACTATNSNLTVTAGATYQITYTIAGNTTLTNTVTASIGGTNSPAEAAAYTTTAVIKASSTGALTFTPTSQFNGTISAVSVKLVTPASTVLQVKNSDGTVGVEIRAGGSGSRNTFIGVASGQANTNTTGTGNTALGYMSQYATTTGDSNTSIGAYTLQNNTTGYGNAALGYTALGQNTYGSQNAAVGDGALAGNTTGWYNTALGYVALANNQTGFYNTAIGNNALEASTTGDHNAALGYYALTSNTTGTGNLAVGDYALSNFTTGTYNIALGYNTAAGNGCAGGAGCGANYNAAIGYQAGNALQTGGNYNVLLGYQAGLGVTTGGENIVIGYSTANSLTSGSSNVLISPSALTGYTNTGNFQLDIGDVLFGNIDSVTQTNRRIYVKSTNSAAFQVTNATGVQTLTVDTSGNNIILGASSSATGTLQFANSGGANKVGIQAASASAGYTLVLPNAAPGTTQCLQGGATTATNLQWGSCGGGMSLAAVDSAGVANANGATLTGSTLNLNSASASFAGVVNTSAQTFAGAKTIQSTSATAFIVQNTSSAKLFQVDTANNNIYIGGNNSGELQPWQTSSNFLPGGGRWEPSTITANGYVYDIGGMNISGTDQSTVYYAKLNANGSLGSWSTSTNSLPAARSGASSIVANGYVYIIGGSSQSTIYYAKLKADGSLGIWNTASNSLPAAVTEATSVLANGYVYVIGGSTGGGSATVYYAKLNSDGSIGTWITGSSSLPAGRRSPTAVVANGYVYVMGGSNVGAQNSVYYGQLNSDGSIAGWSTSPNSLPAAVNNGSSAVANGYVYVMGGVNAQAVYYSKLNADGSVGTWSTALNALPGNRDGAGGSVYANGYMYIVGGSTSGIYSTGQSSAYYTSTERVQVGGSLDLVGLGGQTLADPGSSGLGSTGGSLTAGNGTFVGDLQVQGQTILQGVSINSLSVGSTATIQTQTNSTVALQVQNSSGANLFQVDTAGNNIYIGGNNSGELQSWQTASNALPTTISAATVQTANGYVYVFGGDNGSGAQSTVYYSKLNSDGSVGSWTTSTNSLPAVREYASSAVSNGYAYVIGGTANGTIGQQTVYYAKLNADGSVGTWITAANALPATRYGNVSVVANGYIYVLAGWNATPYYAKLNSDGSVGVWKAASNVLPVSLGYASAVVANGYVYVLGGDTGSAASTVYYSKLNLDGSLGTWSTATNPMPTGRKWLSAVVANGYVYALGGYNGAAVTTVYYSKLNLDGSVGTWNTAAKSLPVALHSFGSIVANGYVYSLGGYGGGQVSTVYYSSTQRVQVGGSLDLVGYAGQTLADPGSSGLGSTGGSLTAGNGTFVGDLQVQGQTSLQSVNINSTLHVADAASIQAAFSPSGGGANVAETISVINAPTSVANTATGLSIAITDATVLANTIQGFVVDTSGIINASATVSTAIFKTKNSATAFQVQNASAVSVLGVDTSANKVLIGAAGAQGNLVISGTTSGAITITTAAAAGTYALTLPTSAGNPSDCLKNSGTAGTLTFGTCSNGGTTKTVVLEAEYPGGVIHADGTNNTGTLTTDIDTTPNPYQNYYQWTSSQGTVNDYDVYVRIPLPTDLNSTLSNFKIYGYGNSTSTANNDIQVTIRNAAGTNCASSVSILPGTASTWAPSSAISLAGCSAFSSSDAGSVITVIIHMISKSSNAVRTGEISYQYTN